VLPIIFGLGMILLRMLKMDIDRSRSERQLRRLTQKLGILEEELAQTREALKLQPSAETTASRTKTAQIIPLSKSGDA